MNFLIWIYTFPKEAFGAEATMLAVVEEPH